MQDWNYISDSVMGGVSIGAIIREPFQGKIATRLYGQVSMDNDGGFLQMAFNLDKNDGIFNAASWTGLEIDLIGNNEEYDIRLRTDELNRPWQSFRKTFLAPREWIKARVPFADLQSHRTKLKFKPNRLRRIGILAIGREFKADIAVAAIRFYQ